MRYTGLLGIGAIGCAGAFVILVGCGGGGGGGGGGSGGSAGGSTSTGDGGMTGTSTQAGGQGGTATQPPTCVPGAMMSCYTGPPGTEGVGECKAGLKTCNPAGTAYGACAGQVVPAPKNCATPAVDEACDGNPGPCTDPPIFGALYGGDMDQTGDALATDAAGNIYLSGYHKGTIDFGLGALPLPQGMLLVKLDPAGQPIWQKDYDNGYARSIAVDAAGSVILFGGFHGLVDFGGGPIGVASEDGLFLVKLDASGNHLWSRSFAAYKGDSWDWFVSAGPSGEIVISTTLDVPVDLGGGTLPAAGAADVVVAQFDASGNHVWSKRFGGSGKQYVMAAAADAQGNVVFTGLGVGIDLGGGPLGAGGTMFVAKLDSAGNHLWSKAMGGPKTVVPTGLALDPAGNIAVAGVAKNGVDLGGGAKQAPLAGEACFAGKLSAAGAHQWSMAFGCHLNPYVPLGPRIAADATGAVAVSGSFDGQADFGFGPVASGGHADAFAFRVDASGAPVWAKTFGSKSYDQGLAIAVDPGGNVIATGHVEGDADLGGGLLTSQGDFDIFLVKLAP